jgi:Sulfotransferase family
MMSAPGERMDGPELGGDRPPMLVFGLAGGGTAVVGRALAASISNARFEQTSYAALASQVVEILHASSGSSEDKRSASHALAGHLIRGTLNAMTPFGAQIILEEKVRQVTDAVVLHEIFPDAHAVCVYRDCRDVIRAILEMNALGCTERTVLPYVRGNAQNLVHGLALYWSDHTGQLQAIEREWGDECQRIRYEDVVADISGDLARLVSLSGVGAGYVVAEEEREVRINAGNAVVAAELIDYLTSRPGCGRALPMERVGPKVRAQIQRLNQVLGYADIDLLGRSDHSSMMFVTDRGARIRVPLSGAWTPARDGASASAAVMRAPCVRRVSAWLDLIEKEISARLTRLDPADRKVDSVQIEICDVAKRWCPESSFLDTFGLG